MNATTLREMLGRAPKGKWYVRKSDQIWADGEVLRHVANVMAEADVTDPEMIVAAVNIFGPLLDVLEAAEKAQYGVVERCGRGEETGFYRVGESDMKAMRDAIAALYRRAGEMMG